MLAARGGNVDLVKLLVQKGADVKAKNHFEKTAKDLAKNPAIIEVLSTSGKEKSQDDGRGM